MEYQGGVGGQATWKKILWAREVKENGLCGKINEGHAVEKSKFSSEKAVNRAEILRDLEDPLSILVSSVEQQRAPDPSLWTIGFWILFSR